MCDSSKLETEELLTCLHVQLFHPDQARRPLFHHLLADQPHQTDAEDPVRFGRDHQACRFVLNDTFVSRKQFSIQAFRKPGSAALHFMVQNMSLKAKLLVGGSELGHLEQAELRDKSLLRFGRYEMLIWSQAGESECKFEVLFETRNTPPSQDLLLLDAPCKMPVKETNGPSWRNLQNEAPVSQEPLESDETFFVV